MPTDCCTYEYGVVNNYRRDRIEVYKQELEKDVYSCALLDELDPTPGTLVVIDNLRNRIYENANRIQQLAGENTKTHTHANCT